MDGRFEFVFFWVPLRKTNSPLTLIIYITMYSTQVIVSCRLTIVIGFDERGHVKGTLFLLHLTYGGCIDAVYEPTVFQRNEIGNPRIRYCVSLQCQSFPLISDENRLYCKDASKDALKSLIKTVAFLFFSDLHYDRSPGGGVTLRNSNM